MRLSIENMLKISAVIAIFIALLIGLFIGALATIPLNLLGCDQWVITLTFMLAGSVGFIWGGLIANDAMDCLIDGVIQDKRTCYNYY